MGGGRARPAGLKGVADGPTPLPPPSPRLQNNLHELWALLNFLLPDVFGDAGVCVIVLTRKSEPGAAKPNLLACALLSCV